MFIGDIQWNSNFTEIMFFYSIHIYSLIINTFKCIVHKKITCNSFYVYLK